MAQAAKAIGNTELEEKFTRSLEMLERPNTVIFAASSVLRSVIAARSRFTDRQLPFVRQPLPLRALAFFRALSSVPYAWDFSLSARGWRRCASVKNELGKRARKTAELRAVSSIGRDRSRPVLPRSRSPRPKSTDQDSRDNLVRRRALAFVASLVTARAARSVRQPRCVLATRRLDLLGALVLALDPGLNQRGVPGDGYGKHSISFRPPRASGETETYIPMRKMEEPASQKNVDSGAENQSSGMPMTNRLWRECRRFSSGLE